MDIALVSSMFFFVNDPATTEIYTLSLHDALPISCPCRTSLCLCLYLCAAGASSISFNEFDVGYVQHQFLRPLALCRQETLQSHCAIQLGLCNQSGLRFKCDCGQFGLDFSLRAGLVLFRFVLDAELHCRHTCRGVAQST